MEAASATTQHAPQKRAESPFRTIVCGIDGSPSAVEAAHQASALAGAGTRLELVAITHEWGYGPNAGALLSAAHADHALNEARSALADSAAEVVTRRVNGAGSTTCEKLLSEAAGADLLVVGRHGYSRVGGIIVGSTTTNLLHRAQVPVLVAVAPPAGVRFPARILVAADGPDHPEDAVRLAGAIGACCQSEVMLVRVDWSRRAKRPEIAEAVAELSETTGTQPLELLVGGTAHRAIIDEARRNDVSLVITGSRGLTALHALRSVSERVAHEAPCSVLVVHGYVAQQNH